MDVQAPAVVFAILGVLLLAGLVLALVWLARTFKRWVNTGLLAAAAVVLTTLVGGTIGLATTGGGISELQSGPFTRLTLVSQARIEANNAKSNESLTLIARGSGAAFEQAWQSSAGQVQANLDRAQNPELGQLWQDYAKVHTEIRELDDSGKWEQAVSRATGSGKDSANARFSAFDTSATTFIDEMASLTRDGLRGPRIGLVIGAVLIFVAGIAAAVLGRRGVAERLRAYRRGPTSARRPSFWVWCCSACSPAVQCFGTKPPHCPRRPAAHPRRPAPAMLLRDVTTHWLRTSQAVHCPRLVTCLRDRPCARSKTAGGWSRAYRQTPTCLRHATR